MTRKFVHALVLLVAAGLAMVAVGAERRVDLAGIYLCEGTNPDGTPYRGLVEITQRKDSYDVQWTLAQTEVRGVGIFSGGVLAVSYFGGSPGVVVYRVGSGQLVGEWTVGGADGHLFSETLTKLPKQLRERLRREGPSALRAS